MAPQVAQPDSSLTAVNKTQLTWSHLLGDAHINAFLYADTSTEGPRVSWERSMTTFCLLDVTFESHLPEGSGRI